ncbi:hypothetical protein ACQRIU_006909 [Beauveria bassiana]
MTCSAQSFKAARRDSSTLEQDAISYDSTTLDVYSSSPASASAHDAFAEDDGPDDCGSFVSSDDEDGIEYFSEPIERYIDGLYYPICIGDVLADTYRIVHKLGWGGFSTVWMARNLKSQKMVALKIGVVGLVSNLEDRELEMQREIRDTVKDPSRLVTFLDTFPLAGVKGTHQVMVMPVRGPSLSQYWTDIPWKTRVTAAKDLLLAVKSIHDANIILRDLNSGSVLWDIGDIDDYTLEMAYQEFGRPRKMPLWFPLWKKGQLVESIEVKKDSLRGGSFLADFGMAIKAGTPVKQRWQAPTSYCAPERFHGINPSFASDMWSYMCIFAELYMGCAPFQGMGNTSALTELVKRLGPLPLQWASRYDAGDAPDESCYDQTRKPVHRLTLEEMSKRWRPDVSDVERKLFVSVLFKGFAYLPENRPTAAELLQDEDFNALMAIYEC